VYWSNAEYDALCDRQGSELDPQARAEQVQKMQEVMYAENPQNVLAYFDYLQAVNTEKWEGWTPYYSADGPVFYNGMIQSYLNVGPRTGAASADADGSSRAGLIAGLAAAVAVALAVVVWWLLRRRGGERAEEA
jgi:hypothetical protein